MTTPVPESEPYADSGGPAWDVQPAVPGWSVGQNWYTGPLFDDTGWHIDLSNVDWAGNAARQDAEPTAQPDGGMGRGTAFRYEDRHPQDGNGAGPSPAGFDRPPEPPAARPGRPPGRHARHARPDDQPPQRPGARSGQGGQRRATLQPARSRPRRAPWPDEPAAPPTRPSEPRPYQLRPPYEPALPGSREPGSQAYGPRAYDPRVAGPPQAPAQPAAAGSASIVRSSGVMAVGTLGSRLTGFLRTIAQSWALGITATLAASYNLANTLPNVVYSLALGGILTSVIVPLIVNAAKRDSDRGEGYDQRMFTLITAALLGITLIATVVAAPLVNLYKGSSIVGAEAHLTITFAYFFIPQIFFYGISSLIGAILNSRGSFAAPMWTPIINNAVVIAILVMYVAVAGLHKTPATISSGEIELLGFGTTLGIIAQTVALVPALRRVGFRWQLRLDFRRAEVTEIGRMAGWMFGYVAATQVAFLVTTNVAGDASKSGITTYSYAWLLFQLPYAVVGISVITALLPRMSAHAAERRFGLVRQDFSTGIRLAAAIVVPCSLVLAVLGPKLAEVFLAHGAGGKAGADYVGVVFAVFCLGLLPYMIFQLQLRVFYSLHDSKTPALIGLVTMTVNIVANLLAFKVLPHRDVIAGLGVGFGLANLVGMVLAWRILTRRLRGLDGYLIGRSLVRMHAATLPAALVAVLVGVIAGGDAIVDVIVGGGLALAMYLLFAKALRIEELSSLSRTLLSRLGR